MEGDSRRKRKAKQRTKAREEDLHIAGGGVLGSILEYGRRVFGTYCRM